MSHAVFNICEQRLPAAELCGSDAGSRNENARTPKKPGPGVLTLSSLVMGEIVGLGAAQTVHRQTGVSTVARVFRS